ncbi:MAG: alkaline phosphatase D family protein [Gammaproteobacteria bacterium]|nr:alkaline phosphatase D family protein [Gammaproteobacteria bacterium]
MIKRRDLLRHGAGLLGYGLLAGPTRLLANPPFENNPFTLGVASGYPLPNSVVLWTRLAPSPLAPDGGMPAQAIPVQWEIATDDNMRDVVRRGTQYATPDWAHSVHVEPPGLEPGREYWYRFRAGDAVSPVGRTRTAPGFTDRRPRVRLALASCQMYEHGYYAAYKHMLDDDLDLIVHVGDYIYELSWGRRKVRRHPRPECYTLDDYRAQHALYRLDPDLQAAHGRYPWMLTWDDHEVDNDYADDISEWNDDPRLFLARRAAAYQAYYEHLPLPRRAVPFGAHMRLHTTRWYGDLVQLHLLDGRQYRSPLACPRPGRRGGNRIDADECAELFRRERSMLGARQEAWLQAALQESRATWNLLAQQTVMSRLDEAAGDAEVFWTDNWNGYPAARARLLQTLRDTGARNPVTLSGDIHAFIVGQVFDGPEAAASESAMPEVVTTSISSLSVKQVDLDEHRRYNPHILLAENRYRGYTRLTVDHQQLQAELIALDDVTKSDSARRILASYVVAAGESQFQRSS